MLRVLILVFLGISAPGFAQRAANPGQSFRRFDRDGDAKLTREEAGGARWFDRLDRNRDGVITLDEVPAPRRGPVRDSEPPNLTTRLDIAYGDHDSQRLDIYAPKEAKDAPVMVYIHGGGWRRGDKSAVGQKVEFLTGQGWVFVSINYRLLPEGKHPANVQDVARAVAWVHDHIALHGGHPEEIFVMGHSAGCHLASLVATDGRNLKKAGKSLGIIKGVIALDTQAYNVPKLIQDTRSPLYVGVFGEDEKTQRDASPIYHVAKDKGIPPFLICYSSGIRGSRPNPNRPAVANAFAEALKMAGVPAKVVDASDRNHGEINAWFGNPEDQKVTGKAMEFLNNQLAKDQATPP